MFWTILHILLACSIGHIKFVTHSLYQWALYLISTWFLIWLRIWLIADIEILIFEIINFSNILFGCYYDSATWLFIIFNVLSILANLFMQLKHSCTLSPSFYSISFKHSFGNFFILTQNLRWTCCSILTSVMILVINTIVYLSFQSTLTD